MFTLVTNDMCSLSVERYVLVGKWRHGQLDMIWPKFFLQAFALANDRLRTSRSIPKRSSPDLPKRDLKISFAFASWTHSPPPRQTLRARR